MWFGRSPAAEISLQFTSVHNISSSFRDIGQSGLPSSNSLWFTKQTWRPATVILTNNRSLFVSNKVGRVEIL